MIFFIFTTIILLFLGFYNPQASLFWYPKKRTNALSSIIYGMLLVLFICMMPKRNSEVVIDSNLQSIISDSVVVDTNSENMGTPVVSSEPDHSDVDRIKEKLKDRAARDWPNDYTTQEYWIDQELEDYSYMTTIPDGPIKREAEQNWPNDYSTQKYWYNEQIAARERLNH